MGKLTHTLTKKHVETTKTTRIELVTPYKFEHVLSDAYAGATKSQIYDVYNNSEYYYSNIVSPANIESTHSAGRNISNRQYIPAGKYVAVVTNENGFVRLYKLGVEGNNYQAILVGEYKNGAQILLTEDNAYYLIADEVGRSIENLTNYISTYEEVENVNKEVIFDFVKEIEEPIGFDGLQMQMKRHEHHGMGVEFSIGELEFYGEAAKTIRDAYNSDIDSMITYEVSSDEEIVFAGELDMSTYSLKQGEYESVSVKVGDAGNMTIFNNRTDTDIDLVSPTTIDGLEMALPEWKTLNLPTKHLVYTNKIVAESNIEIKYDKGDMGVNLDHDKPFVFLNLGTTQVNEFGSITEIEDAYSTDDASNVDQGYVSVADHESKFGVGTRMIIDADVTIQADKINDQFEYKPKGKFYYQLCAEDGDGNVIYGQEKSVDLNYIVTYGHFTMQCKLQGELNADKIVKYYLMISYGDVSGTTLSYRYMTCYLTIEKGSYFKMTMKDTLDYEDTPTKSILIHDALNVVAQAISENEMSVKSEWYQTPDSYLNSGLIGGGACKALTNGYHIRGLFRDKDNLRNMPVSFKTLIQSLEAIDCVGWGFEQEGGKVNVRVERWDWFYNDTPLIEVNDAREVTIEVDTDRIITELNIGYKKYSTESQYNSIDSPFGKRTFVNGIKSVARRVTKESEFVADNYAIEEARRARTQVGETEETTYDENIFVLELMYRTGYPRPDGQYVEASYEIAHSATRGVNVGNTKELINAKLTPRHMASRWRDYIFATNNTTPFRFVSGEINYKSSFMVIPEDEPLQAPINSSFLKSFATTSPQKENDDIAYTHAKFKAEKITFSYPISFHEYKVIKANPYGLVKVNEIAGWISDFKYSFADGMAEFTLIAKY